MAKQKNQQASKGAADNHSEELLKTAKRIKKGIDHRADDYLNGTYDPGNDIRKTVIRGTASAVVVISLLTGLAFSNPADITEDQSAANYRPAPIVMDVDDFVNAPVDDDDESDADEQKGAKMGVFARFRQAVSTMPQSLRILIVLPLWAGGTVILTAISFLWNVIFASPLAAFIASLFFGFAILTGLFTVTAKALFPDVPIRKLLSKRNLLILGVLALVLSGLDAVAPMYWHQYPLAAALVKLTLGGAVIGWLANRTGKLFHLGNITGLPPKAV